MSVQRYGYGTCRGCGKRSAATKAGKPWPHNGCGDDRPMLDIEAPPAPVAAEGADELRERRGAALAEMEDALRAALMPRLDEADAEWVMSTFIAPLFGNGDAADLADFLAKHKSLPLRISWAAYPGCSCGWLYPADSHGGERLAAFEQHRAASLLPIVETRVQAAANQRAAEGTDELREALVATLRVHMLNIESWYGETADALLAGPLAPLLADRADAEALASYVLAMRVERDTLLAKVQAVEALCTAQGEDSYVMTYALRRALDGAR